ncbi:MAG: CobW family GTP-binding protein [Gammaproteobacteria bacterium]
MLPHPAWRDAAVIVNELGETGIDHLLLDVREESLALLADGCLCCALRSDLPEALARLEAAQLALGRPPIARVVVETSGRAEPGPLLMSLLGDPGLAARYRLDAVVATVDSVHAPGQSTRFPEFSRQLSLADRVVITKADLAASADLRVTRRLVQALAPSAKAFLRSSLPRRARALQGAGLAGNGAEPDALRWLGHAGIERLPRHLASVRTLTVVLPEHPRWEPLYECLASLLALQGERILRMKGVLRLAGEPLPVAVHAVHHQLHAPVALPARSRAPEASKLVFITDGLAEGDLLDTFRGCGLLAAGDALQSK